MAAYVKELLFDIIYRRSEEPLEPHDYIIVLGSHHEDEENEDEENDFYGESTDDLTRGINILILPRQNVGSAVHIAEIDLKHTLEVLYKEGSITYRHLKVLDLHVSGYSLVELIPDYPDAESLLIQVLSLLEDRSEYTDERFLTRALTNEHRMRYNKIKPALRKVMMNLGRTF